MKLRAELIFPVKLKDQPILCDVCKKFDLTMTIQEASFTTDTGWAVITFQGDKADIVKSIEYLKKLGVVVKKSLNFI